MALSPSVKPEGPMAVLLATARRRRLPDPRVLVGVLLVAGSAAGTTALVSSLTRTVVVYRADAPIVAGDRLDTDRLGRATVRLGESQDLYLTGPLPADGLVATRTVAAGELVPRSAVGSTGDVAVATVVVDLASPLAEGVESGDLVDLWSAARLEGAQERYGPPVVLAGDAVVARVPTRGGLVAGAQEDSVELQVPRDRVAAVLEAQARGARLAAVAVGGSR